jgi:hypothetical protein
MNLVWRKVWDKRNGNVWITNLQLISFVFCPDDLCLKILLSRCSSFSSFALSSLLHSLMKIIELSKGFMMTWNRTFRIKPVGRDGIERTSLYFSHQLVSGGKLFEIWILRKEGKTTRGQEHTHPHMPVLVQDVRHREHSAHLEAGRRRQISYVGCTETAQGTPETDLGSYCTWHHYRTLRFNGDPTRNVL